MHILIYINYLYFGKFPSSICFKHAPNYKFELHLSTCRLSVKHTTNSKGLLIIFNFLSQSSIIWPHRRSKSTGSFQLPAVFCLLLHLWGWPLLLPGGGWPLCRHMAWLLPYWGGCTSVIRGGHEVLDKSGKVKGRGNLVFLCLPYCECLSSLERKPWKTR